jgi:uncharacterized protein (TIGR02265 family)
MHLPHADANNDAQAQATRRSVCDVDGAIALVAPHCDIVERLAVVPPSARVRGLYLKAFDSVVAKAGKAELYRRYFANERWSALRMYPLRDYMIRLAVAGAALRDPERVHQGMYDVWCTNATTFATSLLGRTMLRLLSHDPVRLTEQGLAARRQTYHYGQWSLVRHGPKFIQMFYKEEYIWIESAVTGGAMGAFEACGITVNLETRLTSRFDGTHLVTW